MTSGFQRSSESRYETGKREQAAAFLDEIQGMIDCGFRAASVQAGDEFPGSKEALAEELSDVLDRIYSEYCALQSEQKTGRLKWIYLSFLRSSMKDHYPAYRIDFYDERDCFSDQACSGVWEFAFLFSHFDKIRNMVLDAFRHQSKVKEYEADALLYALYDRFHDLASRLLPSLVEQKLIRALDTSGGGTVTIREGGLFDKTEIIGQWGD